MGYYQSLETWNLREIQTLLTKNKYIIVIILSIILTNEKCILKVRGDPDGCGLDLSLRYSPSSELRDLPPEDLLNIKKGWLMKQGSASDVSYNLPKLFIKKYLI